MYGLALSTAPTIEPVTLDEAKYQCGISLETVEHDEALKSLITTARLFVERATGRQLINATWDLVLDRFPAGAEPIRVPKNPLVSVTSITYLDTDGATQTWSSANYRVNTSKEPGTISLAYQVNYPSIRMLEGAVTVRFVAGYGVTASAVPEPLRDLVKLLVRHWFDGTKEPESSVASILASYSVGDEFTCYAEAS